jgi:hypothetical protein
MAESDAGDYLLNLFCTHAIAPSRKLPTRDSYPRTFPSDAVSERTPFSEYILGSALRFSGPEKENIKGM